MKKGVNEVDPTEEAKICLTCGKIKYTPSACQRYKKKMQELRRREKK